MSGRRKPVIYLASPFGFSETAKLWVLPQIIEALKSLSIDVYEPFATNAQNGLGPSSGSPEWALDIAYADRDAVRTCDAIFAVINGVPPDEGVAVELGVAMALGKPTFLFRDDFRKAADSQDLDVNLMLYGGLPKANWRDHVYHSLDQLAEPSKALARWATGAYLKCLTILCNA